MTEIRFDCPICQRSVNVDVDEFKVMSSENNPVPIVITHGEPEHATTIFVDKQFRVRATSVSNIVQRIENAERDQRALAKKHVPIPCNEDASLVGLSNLQVKIVALSDGKKSVEELAQILEEPIMRVKIVCEQLVRLGKLDSVRVVIDEK